MTTFTKHIERYVINICLKKKKKKKKEKKANSTTLKSRVVNVFTLDSIQQIHVCNNQILTAFKLS